jgi:acyl-CoA thioester hydrolase
MSRIDRARLEKARFPVVTDIPTRWQDLDNLGHVNNAAVAVILQEARSHFVHAGRVAEFRGGLRTLVAALAIEYVAEMHFPGAIEIRTGVLRIGRTSLVLGQVGRQGDRTTLYAETVMVQADDGGPTPFPADVRAAYEALLVVDG